MRTDSQSRADGSGRYWLTIAVLMLFVASCLGLLSSSQGDDLSSSYFACRLLASGQAAAVYDHDAHHFHEVDTKAWKDDAVQVGFSGFLHPFVQTPLWAILLRPACTGLSFSTFNAIFFWLSAVSLATLLFVVAWEWAPLFLQPLPLVIACAVLLFSEPMRYTMFLTQTHPLFLLLTVCAIALADRLKPARAGLLLALAAAVKVTPGFLVFYWIGRRQWKAVLWFGLASAALLVLTVLLGGWALFKGYLESLHRVSDTLLVAYNNQSLAAAIGRLGARHADIFDWRILPLPLGLKLSGLLATVVVCFSAGYWDRSPQVRSVGACAAIVAATIFSPLAWSHYFVVLAIPALVIAHRARSNAAVMLLLAASVALNFRPLALDQRRPEPGSGWNDSFLFAALVILGVLIWLALRPSTTAGGQPSAPANSQTADRS